VYRYFTKHYILCFIQFVSLVGLSSMNKGLMVTKRDGTLEQINLDKIHRVITWAAEGLENVSVSQVELRSHIQFYEGIRTSDIHETIIKAAADLISKDTPDYQYLAARLAVFHLRKKAFGHFDPPRLYDHVKKLVRMGKYDPALLADYTREEWDEMDGFIDHWRDMTFSYAAVKQLEGKYLVQNRVTGEIYESAQFLYLLVAASLFSKYPQETRLDYIRRFYDATSTFKISLPTPIMAGVRTPMRQFSSCVLIECGDSLDSINATSAAIVKYVSQRAGIGVNAGAIRALGSPIRGGEAFHTGCIPFYKHFQSAVKSCSQGGVRGGAATVYYPIWHLEVESLLVLKNNRGVEDNRVRHMDYGVQLNKLMYQRLIKGADITLFSPSDVPGLYEAFFADQDKFEELYVKYEQDPNIRKRSVKAVELFSLLMQERASTGRIYIQNVDHCNTHSPFDPLVAPVRQSNLCLEIALPTKPLQHFHDENGEIALCTLSAFNLGKLDDLDEAFQFFDSQNSRGKPLESYDLLKAYHLREMKDKPKEIVHHCVERWEKSALSQEINNLDKIINYILFRLRRWHYQESGEVFTSDELETFKGVSESTNYPYLNPLFATKAVEKLAQQNPMLYHPRFVKTSFQTIQTLINGEQFFDYVQYYAELYEKLFKEGSGLVDKVKKINGKDIEKGVNTFLNNQEYCYRVGDKYLKNLFECTVLFYFDKFGEVYLDEFISKAFLWVYLIRFKHQRIPFKTVEDEACSKSGLLSHIERSLTPSQVLKYPLRLSLIKDKDTVAFPNVDGNIDSKIKKVFGV